MNLDELRQILDLVRAHELAEFEIEHEGLRLKIRKNSAAPPPPVLALPMTAPAIAAVVSAASSEPPAAEMVGASRPTEAADDTEIELAVVKSPIVGTFYRAAEPGASNFVDIGSTVKKGEVLCIIEAMKLMNEIDSEYDGEIVNIYVENGQPVQYGERLFAIRTR